MSSIINAYFGTLQLVLVIAATVFSVKFMLHIIFTPDETQLRKIIREELAKTKDEEQ